MKQALFFLCLFWICGEVNAQQYPPEWVKYTYGGYMYDIQSDSNDRNLSETDFKNYLLNIARTNLAKQIQIRVKDFGELNKLSVNGQTSITYSSSTSFFTDVNLKLVETQTSYSSISKMGYAIAYIDRDIACKYYKNELTIIYNKISNSISLANNFIDAGFKSMAQTELESSLKQFALVDEPLCLMNIFGASQSELSDWQFRFSKVEQDVKRKLSDLKHGTVICLSCNADVFGKPYPTLQKELKGILSANGCSFTDNPGDADWVITINCEAEEYSNVKVGNKNSYFSHVSGRIVIDKVKTAQRIYEDEVTVKGGHTFGYSEAAKAGYKEIKQKIEEIIKKNIEQ